MDHVYKVRRKADGKLYGRKPRHHRARVYFGIAGKVFPRRVDAVGMCESLNTAGHDCEVLEYDVTFGRVL